MERDVVQRGHHFSVVRVRATIGRVSDLYWQSVISTGMRVPPDRSLDDSTTELVELLGHPDPRLRDDVAYPLLATWVGTGEYDRLLRGLGDGILPGLRNGLGADGELSVLRRSFTALVLAEVVARDNEAQLLGADTVLGWGDLATSWYVRERDLRGWVPRVGWAHAVAHGADLLGMFARSRHLGRLELTVLLDVVADRLLKPTSYVWCHGEDDRLAYAVMAVLHRGVVPAAVVEPWVARLGGGARPAPTRGHQPDQEWPTPTARNTSSFLRALYVQLTLGVRGRPDQSGDAQLFATAPAQRADLLLGLVDQIRAEEPRLFPSTPGRRTLPTAQ